MRGRLIRLSWTLALAANSLLGSPHDDLSRTELRERLESIDSELSELASLSLRGGVGTIGYRSDSYQESENREWIQIDLGEVETIEEIVLVPTIWRDTRTGFRADGFPLEFQIVVGTDNETGTIVASFTEKDRLLPRIAPVVIPCQRIEASWIRIEAFRLSPRAWDGRYILQLSQILAFNQHLNVALGKKVTTSSQDPAKGQARSKEYLVNGSLPYLMDAAQGEQSVAFVSRPSTSPEAELSIDLGSKHLLKSAHFHATDLSDSVPRTQVSDFGIPLSMVLEGANQPDFSDALPLIDYQRNSVYEMSPILTQNFPETECRYVRLKILKSFSDSFKGITNYQVGFAEIELFSQGKNVALGKEVLSNLPQFTQGRSLESLTDGRNLFGEILPFRNWMKELARRHELEVERPFVVTALDSKYARQRVILTSLKWLAVLLAAGILVTIFLTHIFRLRHVARIRERLAADLHDELGANLHTIGLLSDLASESGDSPEELETLHRRIRSETERSGIAVRHCTDMLEGKELSSDLVGDMQRASRRIMSKLKHEILIEGEEHLPALKQRIRHDLFLFYKECLVNISRHAEASQYQTSIKLDGKKLRLSISDNGKGISDSLVNGVPSSIKRRARLLGGRVTVESPPKGGTQVVLNLNTRKWGIL
ncbi:MAG: ATP-binding protein [Roseibacillus sp.]